MERADKIVSTELISKEGKKHIEWSILRFHLRFFFFFFLAFGWCFECILEGERVTWHVNSIRYRAFIITRDRRAFLDSVMIDDTTFERFRRGFWISLERIDLENEDSYWWEKCDCWFSIRWRKKCRKCLFFKKLSTLYSYSSRTCQLLKIERIIISSRISDMNLCIER